MATPQYVPQPSRVEVRTTDFARIPPPRRLPPRPGEMVAPPAEPGFGVPCPDAGYGYLLAHEFDDRVVAGPGEDRQDARWAAATLGVRRAGRAGRAPSIDDVEVGRALLGYDGSAPEWFVRWRTIRLHGICRDPNLAQWLADVTESAVGVDDVPPRDQLLAWWAGLDGTTAPGRV
jgi:hypothetical protein